ncbi:MAG: hypothetical protein ACTSPK_09105 [Candidatus Heimdallarchaeota archaeon]
MAVLIDSELQKHLKNIPSLSLKEKPCISALLGTADIEKNEVELLSVVHFPPCSEEPNGSVIPDTVLNQLKSLAFTLPYSMHIVGFVFYLDEEISSFTLQQIATKSEDIGKILTIGCVQNNNLNFYSVSKDKPQKLKVQDKKLKINRLVSLIHTIEFETSDEILKDVTAIKKATLDNLNEHWDIITLNKKSDVLFSSIVAENSQLSRIIEINVPCDDKKLTPQTKKGNIFVALDLHVNLYPMDSQKNKKLIELHSLFNKALTQDLIIKMQRAGFDEEKQILVPPQKIPLKFFNLELNTYLTKTKPSKFEYDLCTSLIYHAKVMAKAGNELQARVLLRDLGDYFRELEDEEKLLELGKTISAIK